MRIEFRGLKFVAEGEFRGYAARRLRFALGRFARRIDRVEVRLADENGPRGGVDKTCHLCARLVHGPEVRVGDTDEDWRALVDRASARLGRTVTRLLECEREAWKPVRPRLGGGS